MATAPRGSVEVVRIRVGVCLGRGFTPPHHRDGPDLSSPYFQVHGLIETPVVQRTLREPREWVRWSSKSMTRRHWCRPVGAFVVTIVTIY
jgi:hypothetical protein